MRRVEDQCLIEFIDRFIILAGLAAITVLAWAYLFYLVANTAGMDMAEVKEKYGEKLCLIGNIDLHYTLTRGTTDDVTSEVEERIRAAGKNGGYIISSAMTLADYCKPENVLAMADAIKDYGEYPISK